jgi:hypothetical protein
MSMGDRADGDAPAPASSDGARLPAHRPGTVTAAGWILYLSGGAGVLGAVAINALASAVGGANRPALMTWSGLVVTVAVLVIVVARGVMRGQRWARSVAIGLSAVAFLADLLLLSGLFGPSETPGQQLFRMVVEGGVVGLLASPSARRYFRTSR